MRLIRNFAAMVCFLSYMTVPALVEAREECDQWGEKTGGTLLECIGDDPGCTSKCQLNQFDSPPCKWATIWANQWTVVNQCHYDGLGWVGGGWCSCSADEPY
jgi:hypothetical protein